MEAEELYILGVGHNTATIIDLVEDCGYSISGLLHYNYDRIGDKYFNYEIKGCFEDLFQHESLDGMNFVLSMGDISIREKLYRKIVNKGGIIPTLIHPTAIVSKRAQIGNGVMILPQSIVQADAKIGDNTVITMNSTVSHASMIGCHCFISGHCIIGAYVEIEDRVHIGQGVTIVSGAVNIIGENSVLGAGSVLRNDIKPNSIYLGNPARFVKRNE